MRKRIFLLFALIPVLVFGYRRLREGDVFAVNRDFEFIAEDGFWKTKRVRVFAGERIFVKVYIHPPLSCFVICTILTMEKWIDKKSGESKYVFKHYYFTGGTLTEKVQDPEFCEFLFNDPNL